MTPSDAFTVAILGNTYYGPIPEGQIWADNFSLSGVLTPAPAIIFDPFTNSVNWGSPTKFSPDSDIFVANGVMNYTCTSTAEGGGAIPRNTPLLPTTQDWSMKVDVHLDPFTLTTQDQFSDLFLGFGKTGDWFNTHVMYEFGRILGQPEYIQSSVSR